MRKLLVGFLLFGASLLSAKAATEPPARPKLVVGIVVDQMRWDYLHRFQNRYGAGGFNRLLNEGFSCDSTHINYLPTVTATGHTSIYTGSVPAIHGIAGNDFIVQATGKRAYCVGDDTVKGVGGPEGSGRFSPRNLLVTTVGDELKLATNFRSKVIGVAMKDRGAILPAGRSADAAYWFDDRSGNWVTSTYYRNELPGWAETFNARKLSADFISGKWEPLYPLNTYSQSAENENPYERPFGPNGDNRLPLDLPAIANVTAKSYATLRPTPWGNVLTLEFAKAAVEGEKLGAGEQTDFLAVSLSAPDAAGHLFATNSPRMEDLYLRLDQDLADFLSWLDKQVGTGNYLVFLTADHGAAHNAQFLADHKLKGGVWDTKVEVAALNAELERRHQVPNQVLDIDNYRVCLNQPLIRERGLDEKPLRRDCVRFLQAREGVAFAVDIDEAATAPLPAPLRERIINGYYPPTSGGVQVILQPGWYAGAAGGTTHGTWNPYDAHIPLIFMGWKIRHGSSARNVNITDIAPTLAALLKIQAPNGCVGEAINEVVSEAK